MTYAGAVSRLAGAALILAIAVGSPGCSEQAPFSASIESFQVVESEDRQPGVLDLDHISITARFTNDTRGEERYVRCNITLSEDPRHTDPDELQSKAVVKPGSSVTETRVIAIEMDADLVNHIEVDDCSGIGGV